MLWGRAQMAQALPTSIRHIELLRRDYPKGKTQCCMFPVLVVGQIHVGEPSYLLSGFTPVLHMVSVALGTVLGG